MLLPEAGRPAIAISIGRVPSIYDRQLGIALLFVILLVVFFRPVELRSGGDLRHDWLRVSTARLEPGLRRQRHRLLLGRVEEDGGSVLAGVLGPTAGPFAGVVAAPEHVEQLLVGHLSRFILDLDDFGVAGLVGANVVVGGVRQRPAHEADRRGGNAFDFSKFSFNAPEAACSKCCLGHDLVPSVE